MKLACFVDRGDPLESASMSDEKIPPRFRKTKTDKWAVMAPVADLETALAEGGKIEVQKKSGDWSSFVVASLGKPFDVDGTQMCYGYGPEDEAEGAVTPGGGGKQARRQPSRSSTPPTPNLDGAPVRDSSEPLPDYQGAEEDQWEEF